LSESRDSVQEDRSNSKDDVQRNRPTVEDSNQFNSNDSAENSE